MIGQQQQQPIIDKRKMEPKTIKMIFVKDKEEEEEGEEEKAQDNPSIETLPLQGKHLNEVALKYCEERQG